MRYFLIFIFYFLFIFSCRDNATEDNIPPVNEEDHKTVLLFVKIPESVMPLERAEKYEDPINDFLIENSLGEVSGGGSMLSKPDDEGKQYIEWVGVDVDVYDPDKALPLLIEKLKKIGVPEGTVIEQTFPANKTIKVW